MVDRELLLKALKCRINCVERPNGEWDEKLTVDCKNCPFVDKSDDFESCDSYLIFKQAHELLTM